eukprot:gene15280-21363_t
MAAGLEQLVGGARGKKPGTTAVRSPRIQYLGRFAVADPGGSPVPPVLWGQKQKGKEPETGLKLKPRFESLNRSCWSVAARPCDPAFEEVSGDA